jgi:hypothetical protein
MLMARGYAPLHPPHERRGLKVENVEGDRKATTTPEVPDMHSSFTEKPRRRPPQRGKAGGRTCHKAVWLTQAEDALLAAKAKEAGLSIASFLRASALGDPGSRSRRAPTVEKEILGAAIVELNKVGSNVNQLARRSNKGMERDDVLLHECLVEIRRILTLFLRAIKL